MRLFFFLSFFMILVLLAAPSVFAERSPDPSAVSKDHQEKDPSLDHIDQRAGKLVSYCKKLPSSLHPKKSCDCLYEAYVSYGDRKRRDRAGELEVQQKKLQEETDKLLDIGGGDLVDTVEDFCINMYGDAEHVVVSGHGRKRAITSTRSFKNAEEKTFMVNRQIELAHQTRGVSNGYCTAYFEVAALEKLFYSDPLGGKSLDYVFQYLSTSNLCGPR